MLAADVGVGMPGKAFVVGNHKLTCVVRVNGECWFCLSDEHYGFARIVALYDVFPFDVMFICVMVVLEGSHKMSGWSFRGNCTGR